MSKKRCGTCMYWDEYSGGSDLKWCMKRNHMTFKANRCQRYQKSEYAKDMFLRKVMLTVLCLLMVILMLVPVGFMLKNYLQ